MPESRFGGLQQRYTMDQILELHGGKARIIPLNYDALTQLRSPLYVKMGQGLADASTDQNARILAELDAANKLRQLASNNNLPHDQLREVIQRRRRVAPSSDDDMSEDEDLPPKFPPGGGGGPPGPSGGPPPSGGGGGYGGPSGFVAEMVTGDDDKGASSTQTSITNYGKGQNDRSQKPPPDRKSPPGAGISTALFRSNLEMLAQMEQLKEETRRAQQQNRTVQEVHHHHNTTNVQPMKEIIREIHGPKETFIREVQQQLAPPPVPQDNTQLLNTLQAAMAQNVDLASFARQMGMSMAQMAEYMRKKPAEVAMASSSSNQPPPPPPGGQAQVASIPIYTPRPIAPERSRSRNSARDPAPMPVDPSPKPVPVDPKPVPPAKADRSRSRGQVPPKPDTKPAAAKAMAGPRKPKMPEPPTPAQSRSTSLASTTNYGPSREASAAPLEIAKEIERSRSRHAEESEIVLPVQKRGRSPPATGSKMQKIVEQLVKSEGVRQINKHTQGMQFAKRALPPRPASAAPAPIKVARSFDEIAGDTESAPAMKQRTTSLGVAQPRRRLK